MTYTAAEAPLAHGVSLRASLNTNNGTQNNPANLFKWQGQSATVELLCQLGPADTVALGLSEYRNRTIYARPPNNQIVIVPSISLAWRHDWPTGWSLTTQATTTTDDSTSRAGIQTLRKGTALGLRVAHQF
jgi:hypothetical protein